jgi:hypothetical protein
VNDVNEVEGRTEVTKYFIIATVLVLTIAISAAAWWARQPRAILRVASVSTTMHPRNEAPQNGASRSSTAPFIATMPAALSTLPTCVQQTLLVRGSEAYVRAKIPAAARHIQPPAVLQYGSCTIEVGEDSAVILRGADRLRIPPHVRFFQNAENELYVLHEGTDGTQLRVYAPSQLH